MDAVLRKVQPGLDAFITEKYHDQLAAVLSEWSRQLLESPRNVAALERVMATTFSGDSPADAVAEPIRATGSLRTWRMKARAGMVVPRDAFLAEWQAAMKGLTTIVTAEFQVTGIRQLPSTTGLAGVALETTIRFELVGTGAGFWREQRVGNWQLDWELDTAGQSRIVRWRLLDENRSRSLAPIFQDVSAQALGQNPSYTSQLIPGIDHWRTVLDGASGIDVYGHNGVSVADVDGDGWDDLYICQPAGLPNRMYRNRGDGTFEDITEKSGLGVLDNTACALFVDINNRGRQDAIVVRASGPLLFLNQGGGVFRASPDAFQFATPPQGAFTGAAVADYDRDGWLDVYFCLYSYYQGAGQYRYPAPYYDARNGPPNFLMRNNRDGSFRDVTRQAGLDKNNTRFSFCCGWGDCDADQWPDLYVVNDFGRKNLYRNNGDGTFTDISADAGVEDVGAGMSVCWLDYDNDGKDDLYVANMWTAAGYRIASQEIFQPAAGREVRDLYRKHAMGNSLLRNRGASHFDDVGVRAGATMGRWAWSSDTWDFDCDGFPDLYIANGMISGPNREDLNSFFWRQVVANSPADAKPKLEYEQGWNAINELIRSDGTWSGFERNVFYLNNGDGTFSDVSAAVGLDFIEDSRTFALADLDQDGRPELVLKNRNGPQVRVVKNVMPETGAAIAFRLTGKKSNRDAIGAIVTVDVGGRRQARILQAGSGFLAQHSKELFFGLGAAKEPVSVTIHWPGGLLQEFQNIPINHRMWLDEGDSAFRSEPFKTRHAPLSPDALAPDTRSGTESVETWLLQPVVAPDFSLPGLNGHIETLASRRGNPVLLHLGSAALPEYDAQLAELEKLHHRGLAFGLQLITWCIGSQKTDPASDRYRHLSFPILFPSADAIGIYNLLYRQLFDRHRDLTLPVSFLVDPAGMLVKIYQGRLATDSVARDCRNIPQTSAQRLVKGLPYPGVSATFEVSRNHLSLGSIFFERGYLEEAALFFELALKDDPSAAEPLYGIGSVYLQQQKSELAREAFERAVRARANYPGTPPNAWNNLGILAARDRRTEEAIGYFQRALQMDPDHLIALTNLGNAYRQAKDWEAAKAAFDHVLRLNPDEAEANYGLGMVFAQLGDTPQAYNYLQKALAAKPAYPEALNNLGILFLRSQRQEDAEKSFRESIRVAPAFDQAYLNLARLYALQGRELEARAILGDLLKQHPGHAQAEKELQQLPQ